MQQRLIYKIETNENADILYIHTLKLRHHVVHIELDKT